MTFPEFLNCSRETDSITGAILIVFENPVGHAFSKWIRNHTITYTYKDTMNPAFLLDFLFGLLEVLDVFMLNFKIISVTGAQAERKRVQIENIF